MAPDFGRNRDALTVENLPTPGAVRKWERYWTPTLNGEPIRNLGNSGFDSREEAWAEAIRWVKYHAGLAFTIRLDDMTDWWYAEDEYVVAVVETVAEARGSSCAKRCALSVTGTPNSASS